MNGWLNLRRWYEDVYHAGIKNPNYDVDPTHFHPERDKECLIDLGIKPEYNTLICGCGAGDDIWLLDKEFGYRNITGVDFSQPAIDFCNKRFPWGKFHRSCVSKLPFESNSFDRVMAMDITEHLPYGIYIMFLFELYRVLKVGGRVAMLPGMTILDEHINLIPLSIISLHMRMIGFDIPIFKDEWVIGKKSHEMVMNE